jgi:hypothetical protein
VTIKPSTMDGIAGVVRWVSAEGAGIEFDCPLYGPVVEHLQRAYVQVCRPIFSADQRPSRLPRRWI